MGTPAHGLMLHHFGPEPWATSAENFKQILRRHIEKIVTPQEFLDRAMAGELSDEIVVTLDDGLRSQWEIAKPILDEMGLGALWFVNTAPLMGTPLLYEVDHWIWRTHHKNLEAFYNELLWIATELKVPIPKWKIAQRYLADRLYHSDIGRAYRYWRDCQPESYEQVMAVIRPSCVRLDICDVLWITHKELLSLSFPHAIGSHTCTHPMQIEQLPEEKQTWEYDESFEILESYPAWVPAFAHPGGRYAFEAPRILRDLGYQMAFRSDDKAGPTVYELPRRNSYDLVKEL